MISLSLFYRLKTFKVLHSVERKISWKFVWIFLLSKWKIWWILRSFWRTTCHGAQLHNCSNSSKDIIQTKLFFFSSKKWEHQQSMVAVINRIKDTLPNNVYFLQSFWMTQLFFTSRPKKGKLVHGSNIAVI